MPEANDAWFLAITLDDLWEGEMTRVRVGGADVLLVHLPQHEIHAYDNRCPHAGAPLHEGQLHLTTLRCSRHLWEFDAQTGLGINPKLCRLRRYAVKVVDGCVFVQLAPPQGSNAITP